MYVLYEVKSCFRSLFVTVELPAADASLEVWAGSGARQHGGDEGCGTDAPHRALRGSTHQGGVHHFLRSTCLHGCPFL